MQPEQATPSGETAQVVIGNPEPASTVTPTTPEVPAETTIDKAEFDRIQKELQKAQMEINQKNNKLSEIEKQQEEARLAQLSDSDRIKEERDQYARELEALKEAENQRELQKTAVEFRSKVIGEYPDEVQKVANALLAKNPTALAWSSGTDDSPITEELARTELKDQLDVIASMVTPAQPGERPIVNANNPGRSGEVSTADAQLRKEAEETGDWSKVLMRLPSVQAQSARVQ